MCSIFGPIQEKKNTHKNGYFVLSCTEFEAPNIIQIYIVDIFGIALSRSCPRLRYVFNFSLCIKTEIDKSPIEWNAIFYDFSLSLSPSHSVFRRLLPTHYRFEIGQFIIKFPIKSTFVDEFLMRAYLRWWASFYLIN